MTRAAQRHINDARKYYDHQHEGLGEEFLIEISSVLRKIRKSPFAPVQFSPNTRRWLLRRFPYSIIYSADEREILIVAVMHQHRHPDAWKKPS